jgi:hypothetical protein
MYDRHHTKAPDEMDTTMWLQIERERFLPHTLYEGKSIYTSKTTRYRGLFDCFGVLHAT